MRVSDELYNNGVRTAAVFPAVQYIMVILYFSVPNSRRPSTWHLYVAYHRLRLVSKFKFTIIIGSELQMGYRGLRTIRTLTIRTMMDCSYGLGIETRVLKNPGPGETRTFCQTRNPGLGSSKTRGFRVCIFAPRALRLVQYYTILNNSKHVFD